MASVVPARWAGNPLILLLHRSRHSLRVVARSVTAVLLVLGCTLTQAEQRAANAAVHAATDRAGSSTTAPVSTASDDYEARFASTCAVCHGADGRSDVTATPVLAGQHSFYAITQLFLFREGRRHNELMTAVAKVMTNEEMQGFASYIATLPPVPLAEQEPADGERMRRGSELARQYKCSFCHGSNFSGGEQVPRIGGQHEEYLRSTLREFKNGERQGYTMAMAGAVSEVPQDDLDTLAYFLARFKDESGK